MPEGVSIALTDSIFEPNPTWTRVDTNSFTAEYDIERGRQNELNKTDPGRARVRFNFRDDLDLTGGANLVGKQISLNLYNPVSASWHSLFRGIVHKVDYKPHPSSVVTYAEIECRDMLDYLAGIELTPGVHGYPLPATVDAGNVFYEDTTTVRARIEFVLDEAGISPAMYRVFSGNVFLQEAVYSAGSPLITVIHDAADAEWPGVANLYVDKEGIVTFHGRFARFNPSNVQYDIETFYAGLNDAARAQIRDITLSESRDWIINAALAYPMGIADADIEGQFYSDATSDAQYGTHSWSAENLLQLSDTTNGTDNLLGTALFAQYHVENFKDVRTRISEIEFRSVDPSDYRAAANWDLLCGADIGHILDVEFSAPRVTLAEETYIEGLRYSVRALRPEYQDVTLNLDLSPKAYWDNNPNTGTDLEGS